MAIRTYMLAAAGAALVVYAAENVFAQGNPGQRNYPNYAGDQNGPSGSGNPNGGNPNRGAAGPNDGPQQAPRQETARGPAAPQSPPPPPFVLNPQQQAELDKVLDAWEQKNGQIKTFKADFKRMKYDPVFFPPQPGKDEVPISISSGEIEYAAPDKGLLHETEVEPWTVNPKTGKQEQVKSSDGEHWACDGKLIYIVDHKAKTVEEIPIPPQLQGQSITQGPLPFVFSAKASELKSRYFIRLITPKGIAGEAWLQVLPKYQRDAQNYSKVELILNTKNMFPTAIQFYGTNGTDRDVFLLEAPGFNPFKVFNPETFSPTPWGFKIINHPPQAAPGPQAGGGAAPPAGGQAQRLAPDASRK